MSDFLINSSGRHLIAGTRTGQIIVFELIDRFEDSVLLNTLEVFSNTNGIRCLEWNRSENRILAISENGSLAVMYWNGGDQISVNSRLNQTSINEAHWSHHHSSVIYTLHQNKQIKVCGFYTSLLKLVFSSGMLIIIRLFWSLMLVLFKIKISLDLLYILRNRTRFYWLLLILA